MIPLHPSLKDFFSLVKSNTSLLVEELWDSPLAYLISLLQKEGKKEIVIITTALGRENALLDDLPVFTQTPVFEFPDWETLPSEEIPPTADIVGERYKVLEKMRTSKGELPIIVTTLQAIMQKLLNKDRFDDLYLPLKKGEEFLLDLLVEKLGQMGYERKAVAADKGEYAVRGGIVDLFPVSSPDPFRIEFDEDEIANIRKYDPVSQVSVEKVDSIVITPAKELELLAHETNLSSFLDYLDKEALLIFDDLLALEDKLVALKEQKNFAFYTFEEFFEKLRPFQKIFLSHAPIETLSEIKMIEKNRLEFSFFGHPIEATRWRHPFVPIEGVIYSQEEGLEGLLAGLSRVATSYIFVCQNQSEELSLKEKVATHKEKEISWLRGNLSSGFFLPEQLFALVSLREVTKKQTVRRQKQRTVYSSLPVEMFSLTPGDAVVHMQSGIGKYLGVERKPNHLGVETEFMILEYAEGAKLFVPIQNANLISRYIGATEETPKFHTLGSSRWAATRERTELAIQGYAEDLLKLQAERVVRGGFEYPVDTPMVKQFGEEFPYVETPDQKSAIENVNNDMISKRSMDRLICGDVGYGKTEVAMRAAFKAVVDGGKQVAVLVPTTVLSMQHFENFSERMANYPIRIALLSRFGSKKEIEKNLKLIAEGQIDIVIGTHRIISKDVTFKNLGLIIIDEEQRFGVKAKEHLKKIKSEVDCLTLSATPIPRTLYMSLVGARDMSVISTPPEDRLPIQTIICQANEDVIKNALLRELHRGGQSYVIHNRVETIFAFADKIRLLLPEAKILVGHGQMSTDDLDHVFHLFKRGEADILVATTIIENGIDIPNANTILVDRADRFGLADLYQIRGRVGRWNKKAYCYFLVPSLKTLSPDSRRRLSALTEATGHGGGMKIALRDLEIRGAGNILGSQQSGHISAIGFHLYCKLLKKRINALQKQGTPLINKEVKIDFPYDARLPEHYINEMALRLEFYGRIGDADNESEIDAIFAEIADRFGPPPLQVEWFHHIARLKIYAARHGFTLLRISNKLLETSRMEGKKEAVRKFVLSPPRTPQELETSLLWILKSNWGLP